jgi:hypothetical protein
MRRIILSGGILLLCIIFMGDTAVAYEEPKFTILNKYDNFELRRYEEYIVAEVSVSGGFKEAGNKGFRMLFNYISGNNKTKREVDMKAPVSQEELSQKIEMTVPVSQEKIGQRWSINFLMPSRFTINTLPEPLDANVRLRKVPSKRIAALRYSGTWSEKLYERKKRELLDLLQKNNLRPVGNPILARYNSPFSLWFLRRNEVLIEVEKIVE